MAPNKWQTLLDQIGGEGGDQTVYYLKQRVTRIRLVLKPGQPEEKFYAPTLRWYQGKSKEMFLVWGLVIGTSKDDDAQVSPTKVRAIRIPRTILRSILSLLAEEHELFDPTDGKGLKIVREEGAGIVKYTVTVAPKPTPVANTTLEWPEDDLDVLARNLSRESEARDASRRSQKETVDTEDEDEGDLPF